MVDHLMVRISDFTGATNGLGLAIYLRVGEPVAHETTRVEGLGLHHAIPVEYDAVIDIDDAEAIIRVDALSLPGFEPGVTVYGSVASINRDRDPMDVAYSKVTISTKAYMQTERVDIEEGVVGGCNSSQMRPRHTWDWAIYLCLLIVAWARARPLAHR
jgi:hypothetical protein